jgi:hypothetical protein
MKVIRQTRTLEMCKEDAKKYQGRTEWRTSSPAFYQKALRKGWLDECCAHMPILKWKLEQCIKDAAKYQTVEDWQAASPEAFKAAKRKKWLDECCAHMTNQENDS